MAYLDNCTDEINQKIVKLSEMARESTVIDSAHYLSNDVKRGLRDYNGEGVLAGLTEISDIRSFEIDENGNKTPCAGELYYRGINIKDLVKGFIEEDRFGFEEISYLLLFGKLPTKKELEEYNNILAAFRELPTNFVRDVIMKRPSNDIMNILARGVLTLYGYDDNPDDISIANVLRQGLQLIAQFPLLSVYGYQASKHFNQSDSLIVHIPNPDYCTAQNILHLLRPDKNFSPLEAKLLDLCLVLHAEHGGGNNSSFTVHVVSSAATDTYSTMAAALGSLKGPRHGGANIKVVNMIDSFKQNLKTFSDAEVRDYIAKLLDKEAFDRSGLIYGMGHAVYSLSDPRAEILQDFVERLAHEKGKEEEYSLYEKIQRLAPEVIAEKRKIYKGVSANVDFYSGLLFSLLDIPRELYTPIFAVSRIVGWTAHRIEELSNNGKIIRPGYKSVAQLQPYVPIAQR